MLKYLAPIWKILPVWLHNIIVYTINNKYIIGTNIVITDEQGRVWLQNHRFWPKHPWGLPGGHVNHNETPLQAIIREVKEELSADIKVDNMLEMQLSYKKGLVVYFSGKFTSPIGQIDDTEVLQTGFFHPHQLPDATYPNHRQLIEKLFVKQES